MRDGRVGIGEWIYRTARDQMTNIAIPNHKRKLIGTA